MRGAARKGGPYRDQYSSLFLRLLEDAARQRRRRKASARRKRRSPRRRTARSARQILGASLLSTQGLFGTSGRQYVSLVAHTAGVPMDRVDHSPRLRALDIDEGRWREVLLSTARLIGSVVGGAVSRIKEADRRGARHVVNTLDVFDSG